MKLEHDNILAFVVLAASLLPTNMNDTHKTLAYMHKVYGASWHPHSSFVELLEARAWHHHSSFCEACGT